MIWTEWDKLTRIAVGDCSTSIQTGNQKVDDYLTQILEESKEDLDALSTFLSSGDIEVRRPTTNVKEGMPPLIPRDQHLVYGDVVYSTFTSMKDRYFDELYYYDTFRELFNEGHNWLQMPMPDIPALDKSEIWYLQGDKIYGERYASKLLLHTATISKAGDSVIMNTGGPGTVLGVEWFKRNLPNDTKIIPNYNTAAHNWGHIDQCWFLSDDDTVVCLRKEWVPECLKDKRIIEIHEYVEFPDLSKYVTDISNCGGKFTVEWLDMWLSEWRGYAQDVCFDTNVLMLAPNKVLLSNPQPKLQKYLELHGIECYSTRLRHGLFWESGVHCCTLDLAREGEKRSIV